MFARACVCEGFVNRLQMNTIAIGYFLTKVARVNMPTSPVNEIMGQQGVYLRACGSVGTRYQPPPSG